MVGKRRTGQNTFYVKHLKLNARDIGYFLRLHQFNDVLLPVIEANG
jgi:hypothetical protein